ncbi:hypothetical protein bmyco0003_14910 [Bacillus pseudomycoides]|nr:hypothetical protein bmyco0002_15350 [Bacillus pseudomycoides]EEM11699.1 hypothetical protein bmyco0003_14910 [Bacillus pseudomycoides]EEM17929.1 hypothetical protein bpmyx0001_15680 [Bacillus pseudomycoides DSM 12442]
MDFPSYTYGNKKGAEANAFAPLRENEIEKGRAIMRSFV